MIRPIRSILNLIVSVSTLLVFIGILSVILALCAFDIFLWIRQDLRVLFSFGGSIASFLLIMLSVITARGISTRRALHAEIPRAYLPLGENDLPRPVFEMIERGFQFTSSMKPAPQKPRNSVLEVVKQLKAQDQGKFPSESIPEFQERVLRHVDWSRIPDYVSQGIIESDVADYYLSYDLKQKYCRTGLSEKETVEFLKLKFLIGESIPNLGAGKIIHSVPSSMSSGT